MADVERDNNIILSLKDGREVETSFLPPYTTAEQIAFEEKFERSFLAIERAYGEIRRAAEAADDSDAPVDPAQAYQIRWILWFAWRRARPGVAAKFATFLEEQLEDWTFKLPAAAELNEGEDQDVVDAELVDDGEDPLVAQMRGEASVEDGSLDPTRTPAPA